MHYIPNSNDLESRAMNFIGREVATTSGQIGRVDNAFVYKNVIRLYATDYQGRPFHTDAEHATIVRER